MKSCTPDSSLQQVYRRKLLILLFLPFPCNCRRKRLWLKKWTSLIPTHSFRARQHVKKELAKRNKERFLAIYHDYQENGVYTITPEAIGRRSLKNTSLNYLMSLDPLPEEILKLCFDQYLRRPI